MVWNIFTKRVLCYVFLVITPLTYCRVYNIEDDAVALYGEHFDEVLRRFRRTPSYLKILQDRYKTMERHFAEVTVQVMQSIETKINQRVKEMVTSSNKMVTTTTTTTNTPEGQQAFFRSRDLRRRDEDEEKTLPDPVMNLDGYYLLHRLTTTKERNDFRQLGFDMARQMVQLIITGMGPAELTEDHIYQSNLFPSKATTSKAPNGNGNGGNSNGNSNGNGNLLVTVGPGQIGRKS